RRHRATAPQSRLPREARSGNLAGAFYSASPPQPGLTPVLVDDVATTGATLSAGRAALLAAGWAPPLHWVFAWTLPPSPP
ncbi:MAG: ComF family protein, partial [Pseudomonadota bacterium]|nr:ComF family protein [Pseudomonadota bacterium]